MSVVLPDFQTLVKRVMLPCARKPFQSHFDSVLGLAASSRSQIACGVLSAFMGGILAGGFVAPRGGVTVCATNRCKSLTIKTLVICVSLRGFPFGRRNVTCEKCELRCRLHHAKPALYKASRGVGREWPACIRCRRRRGRGR